MITLEEIYENNGDMKGFTQAYLGHVSELLNNVDIKEVEALMRELERVQKTGATVFIAGNGGSAATASHMSMDLGQVFFKLPQRSIPLRAISLSDNLAIITAVGNDFGYDQIFSKQLGLLYKEDDVLLVISASGNSPNLLRAAEWVKEKGGTVLGFLGFDGGKLKDLCTHAITIKTPHGEYGPVEDTHLVLSHLCFYWFYNRAGGR
jgi:D-sedoheptulose 7-phosphate isomerase